MRSWPSTHAVLLSTTLMLGTLALRAEADIAAEWIRRLPAGASLSAGLTGMVVGADGVTYVTGINGPSSNTDCLTAAIGPDGALRWSHTFNGGGNWHDQARAIELGPDGEVYVVGNTPGPGSYARVLLLKYDAASGALLNTTEYSSGPGTSEYGGSVVVDADGAVYVGGGTVGDGGDALVLKLDASGQVQWVRTWDGPAAAPYSQDSVQGMTLDPDGNPVVLIHGVMNSLHPDYVVVKYAASTGDVIWEARWGVNGGDYPREIEMDAAGDFYVTGIGINLNDRFSTIKLRGSDGQLLWQAYDGIGYHNAVAGLALDGEGGVYVTGRIDPDGDRSNSNDNFYSVKRDAGTGELLWTHSYGANCLYCFDGPGDVGVDAAGHVLLVGDTGSPPYSGDMILLVLDADSGVELERSVVSGDTLERVSGEILRLDPRQNVLIGGGYYNVNSGAVDMSVTRYASLAGRAGDLDGDGDVDLADLARLLAAFGSCAGDAGYDAGADLDGSGCVELVDLAALLANFGA